MNSKHRKYTLKKGQSAFKMGYALHGYFPPKVIHLIFAEYLKLGVNAVIYPAHNGALPSIWGTKPKQYTKGCGKIIKRFKDKIKLEETSQWRKGEI